MQFKKKKKQNKTKGGKKKGETARVQSLFIAWKGPRFGGFWGSHSFQGNAGGNCQWSREGGAVIRILQSPMGGWGNQLNSIVTHPESSDHPSLLPSPSPPAINNDKSLSKDQLETSSSGITEVPRRCEAYCKGKFDLHFGGYLNFRWLITQKKMSTCIKSEVTAGRGSPCGKYGSIAKSKGRS